LQKNGHLESQRIAQQQQPRTALVIGNADYEDDPLQNPINDATDVATALEELGFAVTLLTDSDWRSMDIAVEEFGQQLQQGGVGVFYYAGHGVQVDGENYLVPTDAELARERDVIREARSLSYVINLMEQTETEVNVLIIDACRDNPFYRQWRSVRGAAPNRGLALSVPPQGTIISFATEPGGIASDGEGRNSPYTANLLKHIRSEGEDVATMFRRVRADVIASTDGDQVPWYQESLIGSFSFNPSSEVATAQPITEPDTLSSQEPTLISSTTGVNYQPLQKALAEGNFQQADMFTKSPLLKAANRESEVYIADVDDIPCEDLRIVDQLWLQFSEGKFGFSVQREIYSSLGGTDTYDPNIWVTFNTLIGWLLPTNADNRWPDGWLQYRELTFSQFAVRGHLPSWFASGVCTTTNHPNMSGCVSRFPSLLTQRCNLSAASNSNLSAPRSNISPQEDRTLMSAATGVNYHPLQEALAAGDFRLADGITYNLILRATGQDEPWLSPEDAQNFSCEDLNIMDKLWLDNSDGKFGLSVQQQIYQRLGGTPGEFDQDIWHSLADEVGWRQNDSWLAYSQLDFGSDAPLGHLPSGRRWTFWLDVSWVYLPSVEACRL